ncbi:MAG TPA: MDR family MFS transporter [Bacteroidota bacterium]
MLNYPEKGNRSDEGSLVLIIISVMLGVFLAGMDAIVVGTAMPTVVSELGGLNLYSWVFAAYMVASAVAMPLFGSLTDVFGKKRNFYASIGIFLLGSALSGMSTSMTELVLFRALQGIGAGGLAAVPFALIGSVFPVHRRGRAYGLISAVWAFASIIGPLVGSIIVLHLSWRWVFYINIPVGIAAVVLLTVSYHETPASRRASIDWPGAAAMTAAIVSLLLFFLRVGEGEPVLSQGTSWLLAIFLGCSALFVVVELRTAKPLISLSFFKQRTFTLANLLAFSAEFSIFGVVAYVPMFVQNVQGGSAADAGLVIAPLSIGWSGASIVSGHLLHRTGEKSPIKYGILFMFLGFAGSYFVRYDSPVWYIVASMLMVGIGMGSQTPSLLIIVQNSLSKSSIGVATATHMLTRTIGGAIGVSLMGAVLSRSLMAKFDFLSARGMMHSFPAEVQKHLGSPQQLLSEPVKNLLTSEQLTLVLRTFTVAIHDMFVVGLLAMTVSWLLSFLLPRRSRSMPAE